MNTAADWKRLFAERVTLQSGASSMLQVRLSSRGLTDEQMVLLGRFLDELLPEPAADSEGESCWAQVELAENAIGDKGLIAVLDSLERKRVSCKCIKLYRNRICDDGGLRLARAVSRQVSAMEEIHLSHNMFSARTLVALCMALAKHDGYPMVGRNRLYIPCWVRMEYNQIARPNDVLEMLRRDAPMIICTADNREDCGPWRCIHASRDKAKVPKVHLFTIAAQARSRVNQEAPSDAVLREEIRKWGGNVLPPAGPAARAAPKTGPGASPKAGARPMGQKPVGGGGAWDSNGRTAASRFGDQSPSEAMSEKSPTGWNRGGMTPGGTSGGATPGGGPKTPGGSAIAGVDEGSKVSADIMQGLPPPGRKEVAKLPAADADASPHISNGGGQDSTPLPDEVQPKQLESSRVSVVLDTAGKRRIHPKQLEVEGMSGQFVCPLCSFVMSRPVITSCSHLFCDSCFRDWVATEVSKFKATAAPNAPVPLIPCPAKSCVEQLRKQDIQSLDKADTTKVGAVQLLQRLRNNLRVKCVHHVDNFQYAFGKDAERASREIGKTCNWIGDLAAYEDHMKKGCPIEQHVLSAAQSGDAPASALATAASEPAAASASPTPAAASAAAAQAGEQAAATARTQATGGNGATADADSAKAEVNSNEGEVRVVRHEYAPRETDKAQIALKANELVRIFEVTDSGWAAGVRLCKQTLQEVGDAGWFPAGYLYPSGYVAS